MSENSYPICGVFDVPDEDDLGDAVSDFVCIPASNDDTVVPEPQDGSAPTSFLVLWLTVLDLTTKRKILTVANKSQATLTDSRLTIACSKYGSGGEILAEVFGAGKKALSFGRGRGKKMMVAQVRYPWVETVRATDQKGLARRGGIELTIRQANGDEQKLMMELGTNVDACGTGAELVRRAASFVNTHDEDLRARHGGWLETASAISRIASGETVKFPESRPVSPSSARIGRSSS